jgi:hypothetical protein
MLASFRASSAPVLTVDGGSVRNLRLPQRRGLEIEISPEMIERAGVS